MSAPVYVPSSGGDDGPAINAAFAGSLSVVLGAENYKVGTTIVVPSNGVLEGQYRATTITKIANCDTMRAGYCSTIKGFRANGEGSQFSGRGLVLGQGTAYQRIIDAHFVDTQGYALECDYPDVGGLMQVQNCFFGRTNQQAFSVKLPNSDSVPGGNRTFRDIFFSGGYGFDFAGANSTYVDGCNAAQIRMDVACRTLKISNARIGGPVSLRGQGHWWLANNIANGITLESDLTWSIIFQPLHGAPIGRNDLAAGNYTNQVS